MAHKLRKAMRNRDARYTLEGMIEMDEGYFTVESSEIEKKKRDTAAILKLKSSRFILLKKLIKL